MGVLTVLNQTKRDELRKLQDEWMEHPTITAEIRRRGWSARIAGSISPTFAQVQANLLPEWESFFKEHLKELE